MASAITTTVDTTYARIGVTVAGFPSDDPVTVYRRRADGTGADVAVRGASPMNLIGGTAFQWDYEAVSGVAYVYVANDGSADVLSSSVTMTLTSAHLVAVGKPAFNSTVLPELVPETTRRSRATLADVIGRRNPVALTDVRTGLTGTLSLVTLNDSESDDLDDILSEAQLVFLQLPGTRFGARYVLVGDVTETPYTGIRGADEGALWSLDLTEIDRPGGDVSGDPAVSYQLLKDSVQSFSALLIATDNYIDLRSGIGLDTSVAVPQYIGSFGSTNTGASNAVATLPAFTSGDLGIAVLGISDSTKTITIPSGWTQVSTDVVSGTGRYALVRKTLTTDTTVTLAASGSAQKVVTGVIYRNAVVNTTQTARTAGAVSSVTTSAPSTSTTKAGSQVLRLYAALSATANASWSTPSPHTLRRTDLGSGATSMSALAVDRGAGPPGAVAAATSNRSVASASFVGWTVIVETP